MPHPDLGIISLHAIASLRGEKGWLLDLVFYVGSVADKYHINAPVDLLIYMFTCSQDNRIAGTAFSMTSFRFTPRGNDKECN